MNMMNLKAWMNFKKIIRRLIKKWNGRSKGSSFRLRKADLIRFKLANRKEITTVSIKERKIWLTDPYWFLQNHNEIFKEEIYKFTAKRTNPLIIDCGSNIGLSIIYFKFLYPEASIIGIEPDPIIFQYLQTNLTEFGLQKIELHNKAVWVSETSLFFEQDGSLGGKIVEDNTRKNVIEVQTIRLFDLLQQPIDFLKIDIEGAEYEVLVDCKDSLGYVDHLFVEYHGNINDSQNLHEILMILNAAGFRYHIKEANPIFHPFMTSERRKPFDLQLNIFAFRE